LPSFKHYDSSFNYVIRIIAITSLFSSRLSLLLSANVMPWAFGHTRFNCDFVDLGTKKRVVANQKGYRRSELETFDASKVAKVETLLDSEAKV
jgi:hypothetical protein